MSFVNYYSCSRTYDVDLSAPPRERWEEAAEKFGDKIYGRYGFVDAFNPNTRWVDTDVIGINVGIILLSVENGRTGNIWRWFMRNAEIETAMRWVGLVRYTSGRGDSE